MRLQQNTPQEHAWTVDKHMLDDVCVFSGPAVWLLVSVVHLVDVSVEKWDMHGSMQPVETEVFHQEENRDVNQKFLPRSNEKGAGEDYYYTAGWGWLIKHLGSLSARSELRTHAPSIIEPSAVFSCFKRMRQQGNKCLYINCACKQGTNRLDGFAVAHACIQEMIKACVYNGGALTEVNMHVLMLIDKRILQQ